MRPLYIALIIIWFVLGYFLCNKYISNNSGESQIEATPLLKGEPCKPALLFKDGDFKKVSLENFKFSRNSFDHYLLSPEFEELLLSIGKYLDENPKRKMKIKGLFLEDETNQTEYENLGLARAYSVKTYFLTLGVNSSQLLASAKLANPNCFDGDVLQKGVVVAFGQ
ncbi:MAG: hypothetical protein HKO66_13275 [Saprospiraceae bacterium]|nr:hypothetical protein [Bacteroidia bacterium]NNE14776.1 hypothetical protein [Saprospiraceae bacterium]NNL93205.1 hypothetical protein [Saprospiraceae bacterium]